MTDWHPSFAVYDESRTLSVIELDRYLHGGRFERDGVIVGSTALDGPFKPDPKPIKKPKKGR